jgi:hypothetical protein
MTPDPYRANNGGPGDPRDPGSWNRYVYTRGDPVNRIDPSGTCDLNIYYTDPDGTIVVDCIDFPSDGGGGGSSSTSGSGTSGSGTNGSGTIAGGGLINLNCQHLYGSAYANCMGQQQQDNVKACLQSFSNSSLGAAVSFLSAINLIQNIGDPWVLADWSLIPLAKIQAIKVIQDLSGTVRNTDFYSIAGTSQTASIETELGAALTMLEKLLSLVLSSADRNSN